MLSRKSVGHCGSRGSKDEDKVFDFLKMQITQVQEQILGHKKKERSCFSRNVKYLDGYEYDGHLHEFQ